MDIPVVIAAFGTTTGAVATYRSLNDRIKEQLPDDDILWSYTSRTIVRKLEEKQDNEFKTPEKILQSLADQGYSGAILQSLHLFPGKEFHKLHNIAMNAPLPCATGMPLLTAPEDYRDLGILLAKTIDERPEQAILLLGHGTYHPSWTAYYSLEKIFRYLFDDRIFVGVVEQFPDSSRLVEEISSKGFNKVTIIPLFLIAGMHFKRDIISSEPHSWQSRFDKRGIEVEAIHRGLGLLAGIEKIVTRHIIEAGKKLT